MSFHSDIKGAPLASDPGQQIVQLRQVARLVDELAGRVGGSASQDTELDEAARIIAAYWQMPPVVQRRFEALAAETAAWSAAAAEALLAAGDERSRAAAARLADELHASLTALTGLLGR